MFVEQREANRLHNEWLINVSFYSLLKKRRGHFDATFRNVQKNITCIFSVTEVTKLHTTLHTFGKYSSSVCKKCEKKKLKCFKLWLNDELL